MKRSSKGPWIVFGSLAFALLLGLLILFGLPHLFLASPAFKGLVESELRDKYGLEGSWVSMRLHGWDLTGEGFRGTRRVGNSLATVVTERVWLRMDWRGLLSRKWQIHQIEVGGLRIEIPSESSAERPRTQTEPATTRPSGVPDFPLWAALLPRSVQVNEVVIKDAALVWDAGGTAEPFLVAFSKVDAVATPLAKNSWSLVIASARASISDRPAWTLRGARLTLEPDGMVLSQADWEGAESGTVSLSGPLGTPDAIDARLDLVATGVPVVALIDPSWRAHVRGVVDGQAKARLTAEKMEIQGSVKGREVRLVGLPALRALQVATGLNEWLELPLDTAWVDFSHREGAWDFSKVVLESSRLIRAEGALTIRDGLLDGLAQIGVREGVASRIPGLRSAVFTTSQNDWLWANPPMRISGTLDEPKEDLSPRLKSAVLDTLRGQVEDKINQGVDLLQRLLHSK